MTYAAGFSVGERESFNARRDGLTPAVPNEPARSQFEIGRRDALFARSQAWVQQPPSKEPSRSFARKAEEWGV